MSSVLDILPAEARAVVKRAQFPGWVQPMLATLTHQPFSREDWLFERKFDGERCLAFRHGNDVRLMSRNQKEIQNTYPEIAEAIAAQSLEDFVVDGEIVAFEGEVTSFGRLQGRMQLTDERAARGSGIPVHYYVFDICHVGGSDITDVGLKHRKDVLKHALKYDNVVRYTEHTWEKGEEFLRDACRRGWEGLIAKDSMAPYTHGRSRKWLKLKCVREQEMVVGGFTEPEGERVGLGALLVGYYEGGLLRYAGRVGAGYSDETLSQLRRLLDDRKVEQPPFESPHDIPAQGVHWVRPELVAQVKFTEWTDQGRLRHPVYLGLRRDKDADKVVKETAG